MGLDRFTLPKSVQKVMNMQDRFRLFVPKTNLPFHSSPKLGFPEFKPVGNFKLFDTLKEIAKISERLNNDPELQFVMISDLKILNLKSTEEFKESLITNLTDSDIDEKEVILSENLVPYLEKLGLENLWFGANHALENTINPDRLRHCLVSLRTILEHLINVCSCPN